jgi:hypothetical protein
MGLLAGCHSQQAEMQRCVDENNKVVDQSFCQQQGQQTTQQQPDGHGGFIFVPVIVPYHYYYGGWGGYGVGSMVGGGGYAPVAGRSYSTTTRGGFGSSFSGSESGHGAGAGE